MNYLFLRPCNLSPLHFTLLASSLPPPSPELIIVLPTEENRTSDEELLFHFLSFIPPLKWGSSQNGGGEGMVLIQMLHLKILLCTIWLGSIKAIYKYTPWECFISEGKKYQKTSALIAIYYFSFTSKNLNIWAKPLFSQSQQLFTNERKQKANYELTDATERGWKGFSHVQKRPDRLKERHLDLSSGMFSPPQSLLSYTDSAFLTSFLLILPVPPHCSYPFCNVYQAQKAAGRKYITVLLSFIICL